jgi:hypothetical protein
MPSFRPRAASVSPSAGPHGSDDGGDAVFPSDLDTECLMTVRAMPGLTARHLPPRLRPSLIRLEKVGLVRYHGGGWYPVVK